MLTYNLCIIKPNQSAFSETFIQQHIERLSGNKKVLYGGAFPVYQENGKFLILSKIDLISYLFQKKILGKRSIAVRDKALIQYLKREKIDVVFAEYGMVGAMVTEACKQADVPLIIQFHGADAHQQKTVKTYLPYYTKAFAYADTIITVSQDMSDALIDLGAAKEKIFLNPCGVNTELFRQIDIRNSPPNFLSVGRFVAKKSPQSIVKAFKIVCDRIVNAHLWMVGDGPLFEETKALAEMLLLSPKITFTGILPSEEIIKLMKNMRCFVQHSVTAPDGDMEGTPVTILEAASSGLPIVSTKHAGIKQAVIDGKTGFLADENDINAMAERMIEIASSPQLALRLGEAAREHMLKNYAIENQISKLDQIIQKKYSQIVLSNPLDLEFRQQTE